MVGYSIFLGFVIMSAPGQPTPAHFDGESALGFVAEQVDFGPRPTGSPALRRTGDWIVERLEEFGWETSQEIHTLDLENGVQIPVRNLAAALGEQGPAILLGAHYDTRIAADQDGDPDKRDQPVPGANDGGSGTAVLLELGRVLGRHHRIHQRIQLRFFDAEDNGDLEPWRRFGSHQGWIIGSQLAAERLDLDQAELLIVVDMVGDLDQRLPREGFSAESAPKLAGELWELAAQVGYGQQFPPFVRGPIIDDHLPFLRKGLPAVDIIDLDYPHWHTTEDTLDKVSAQSLQRVGRLIQEFLIRRGAIDRDPLLAGRPLRIDLERE